MSSSSLFEKSFIILFFKFSPKDILSLLVWEKEKHQLVASCKYPDQDSSQQPFSVPDAPANQATLARAEQPFSAAHCYPDAPSPLSHQAY